MRSVILKMVLPALLILSGAAAVAGEATAIGAAAVAGVPTAAPAVSAAETFERLGSCARCGMDRTVFAQSRALVAYVDGSTTGTCSLHCAVEDMEKSPGKQVAALKVADYASRQLIEAKSAIWVAGGKMKGVMTSPAKWAFAKEDQAQRFLGDNGGVVVPYEEVLRAVRQEVEEMEQSPELE